MKAGVQALYKKVTSRKFAAFVSAFAYSLSYHKVNLAVGSGVAYIICEAVVDAVSSQKSKSTVVMNTTTNRTVDSTTPQGS